MVIATPGDSARSEEDWLEVTLEQRQWQHVCIEIVAELIGFPLAPKKKPARSKSGGQDRRLFTAFYVLSIRLIDIYVIF